MEMINKKLNKSVWGGYFVCLCLRRKQRSEERLRENISFPKWMDVESIYIRAWLALPKGGKVQLFLLNCFVSFPRPFPCSFHLWCPRQPPHIARSSGMPAWHSRTKPSQQWYNLLMASFHSSPPWETQWQIVDSITLMSGDYPRS